MSVNKVILVGNVGKDPEIRTTESGIKKASFTLATSENFKNKAGEKETRTEWHNIVIWRNLADVVEKYVKKGSQLYLEGKITNRSYEDKDKMKRYITEIVVDSMQMLGKKSEEGHSPVAEDIHAAEPIHDNLMPQKEDDLPF